MVKVIHLTVAGLLGWALTAPAATAQKNAGQGPGMHQGANRTPQAVHGNVPGVQLNTAQQKQIARIRQETQQRVQGYRHNPNLTEAERERRIAAAQREGHERVMQQLTPRQQQQFAQAYQSRPHVAGYRGQQHGMRQTQPGKSGRKP